jgi:uncharacterized membrane protein YeaQ/YmgE (transglycosylase-associated protein family)
MEFLLSLDSLVCLITGGIVGALAGRVIKGFGMLGNIGAGIVGGLIGGMAFDAADIIDVGDIADPVIASLVGSAIVLGIVGAVRGKA